MAVVRVVLTYGDAHTDPDHFQQQICEDLRPGQCYRALPITVLSSFDSNSPSIVNFFFLQFTDITAAWAPRGLNPYDLAPGCSGVVVQSGAGPGTWTYRSAVPGRRAVGASYIRAPSILPPSSMVARWLSAEGMLGLVWDMGRWFAEGMEASTLAYASGSGPRLRARDMVNARKGMAYMRAPTWWKWPDVVIVNGTKYRNTGTEELVYKNADGQVLETKKH
ncbi:MAG: hypothetical protein Q9209_005453 [Squamulea sp. 1 TL-2023]